MHHFRASQAFAISSRASWILVDPFLRLMKSNLLLFLILRPPLRVVWSHSSFWLHLPSSLLCCTSHNTKGHRSTRRGLKSLLLWQQEELPKPQSKFAGSLRVATTTMLQERGFDCRPNFSMRNKQEGNSLNRIFSNQHQYFTTGNFERAFWLTKSIIKQASRSSLW